jgi:phage shock protein PspC (stress-responsive transcriptional regulator)
MENKLYRSRTDVMLGGVCGGLADYLRIDTTLVRLFFILLSIGASGIGVMIYLLLWIIVPLEGHKREPTLQDTVRSGSEEIADKARMVGDDLRNIVRNPNPRAGVFIGVALIGLGIVFLLQNLELPWLNWLDFDVIWPSLLILGGIALLTRHWRGN